MNPGHLATALEFYRGRGYSYVHDAPYVVGKEAYYATKPPGARDIRCMVDDAPEKFLVASGEQSFLQMWMDGRQFKRAVCLTPCFRSEEHTDWNKFAFQKVELINTDDPSVPYLMHMIHDAMAFFESFGIPVRIRETPEAGPNTYDIKMKDSGIELGSYGIRECRGAPSSRGVSRVYRWIYGTGCAEPRLSDAIERHNKLKAMERDRL